jgi:hypothetical protein
MNDVCCVHPRYHLSIAVSVHAHEVSLQLGHLLLLLAAFAAIPAVIIAGITTIPIVIVAIAIVDWFAERCKQPLQLAFVQRAAAAPPQAQHTHTKYDDQILPVYRKEANKRCKKSKLKHRYSRR